MDLANCKKAVQLIFEPLMPAGGPVSPPFRLTDKDHEAFWKGAAWAGLLPSSSTTSSSSTSTTAPSTDEQAGAVSVSTTSTTTAPASSTEQTGAVFASSDYMWRVFTRCSSLGEWKGAYALPNISRAYAHYLGEEGVKTLGEGGDANVNVSEGWKKIHDKFVHAQAETQKKFPAAKISDMTEPDCKVGFTLSRSSDGSGMVKIKSGCRSGKCEVGFLCKYLETTVLVEQDHGSCVVQKKCRVKNCDLFLQAVVDLIVADVVEKEDSGSLMLIIGIIGGAIVVVIVFVLFLCCCCW